MLHTGHCVEIRALRGVLLNSALLIGWTGAGVHSWGFCTLVRFGQWRGGPTQATNVDVHSIGKASAASIYCSSACFELLMLTERSCGNRSYLVKWACFRSFADSLLLYVGRMFNLRVVRNWQSKLETLHKYQRLSFSCT